MAQPAPARPVNYLYASRLLFIVAAVCMLLAALTAAGSDILGAPMWAWGFGGASAYVLGQIVP
jgi:hypothetical protein